VPVRGRAFATVDWPDAEEPPARLPATLRRPRGPEPEPSPVAPPWDRPSRRATFLLDGVSEEGGRRVARYAAWVRADWPKAADLEVARGGRVTVHEVSLARGATTPVASPPR
jgi:hypothetical protein